jgi:hypothetical protein
MSRGESELRAAQASAERARRLLLFPSLANLDNSRPLLEKACANLQQLQRSVGEQSEARKQELLAGLRKLRLTVRRVAALIEGAGRFHAGWLQVLAATTDGYTRDGEPAPPVPVRSLSMEG